MADRRAGKRSVNQRGVSNVDSGTCNVCSAPCSSCMHRNVGVTDESSDENGHGVAGGSQCSVKEDSLLPSAVVNSNKTASEASNFVSSSHDAAVSENAESRETVRRSGISDDSGAVAKTSSSRSRRKRKVSASVNVLEQDEDSTIIKSSSVLSDEMKSQSLRNQSSNHEDGISSERGNFEEKVGPGGNKDREEQSVEGSTPSGEKGKDGKSSTSASFNKSDESVSSVMSESESDDAEVEHDVKVCDICGDAGREDLLAICSGCSDGAEHTYCMRVMLKEVPEGDWLCEECEEAEKQKQEAKRKLETEPILSPHSSGKRHADKIEAAPDAKRQAVEGSTGSPKKSVLPRIGPLSRETSFKGLDRPRGKLSHQSSFSDTTEGARSTGLQLQPPKGAFLKSSSFNSSSSKPKIVDDVILSRKKTVKECSPLDIKEGGVGIVSKSMSSRTTDTGSSSGNDSQAKILASKVHSQEGKSSKQLKDRSTEANASAASTDQKLTSRSSLKGLQSDGKRGSLTKQVSNLSRSRLENPIASGNSREQSVSQADCKDELTSTSCAGEGIPSNGDVASQDGLPRLGKKSKEALGKRQRSSLLSGGKGLPSSQKGGQTAESSDTSGVSDSDPSTTKTVREDINKGNRLRAAVDAALRKKPSFGKNRVIEQCDTSLASNVHPSSDKTVRNQLPQKMHANLWPAPDPYKQTMVTNEKQFLPSGVDTMMPPRSVDLDMKPEVNIPSLKSAVRDWPLVSPPALLRSSAIPDHESIWQGNLEVWNARNQSAMHSGLQAHLSTLASPKVAEVVNKFPEKFSLNEVPRLSTWPAQFRDIGTKEDHIALFFFAKDVESYERNYKPLVDNMIKKDLALKGNLDNVELLIFASNQLPPSCQRWNMLYFLWGVFRGRKEICTNPQKNTSLPASEVLPRDKDPNDFCRTSSPSKHTEKASSLRESPHKVHETQIRTDVLSHENASNRQSSIERSLITKEEAASKEDEPGANHVPCQANGSNNGDSLVKKVQQIEDQDLGGRKDLPSTVTGPGQANQASHRKRQVWELTKPDTVSQQIELVNEVSFEGSPHKKLKTENESSSSSVSRDTIGNDTGMMKKSPKVVFPLDLNMEGEDMELDDDLTPLGNNNDDNNRRLTGTVPNLELPFRGEQTTGLLPFLAGKTNASGQSSHSMNKEKERIEDDDDSASLSLSLSFPGEEKKSGKTPFFLFRDPPR